VSDRVLVTGGCGYIGAVVVEELLDAGRDVRVLDTLLHKQSGIAEAQRAKGVDVIEGDIRDAELRARALDDVFAVIHLAAIVGDPACARDPQLAQEVNVEATKALAAEARDAGVERFVFASTCSNYGRVSDPTVAVTEEAPLAPVSLYAEQKVAVEKLLLSGEYKPMGVTCLRLATIYGVAPRMRFDLTVNEFVRDLWADRELEVFGEQFWRPYVHVRDAARAMRIVLDADGVDGEVFNVGRSGENYTKKMLVEEITAVIPRGKVSYVHRDEDPRDYQVNFDKVRSTLGFETLVCVPDGVREVAAALDEGRFRDPFELSHRNIP
jgi:nucleoside-diphosphate-sugar epimerase